MSAKRMAIIDGCNLLHSAMNRIIDAHSERGKANAVVLLLLVRELLNVEYEVVVVLKEYFLDSKNTSNSYIIRHLVKKSLLNVVPDHEDDDLVILSNATRFGAFIISNDQFRQPKYDRFDAARSRTVRFALSINRQFNPYAEMSKRLFAFNLVLELNENLEEVSIATDADADYAMVRSLRSELHRICSNYRTLKMSECNVLAEYLQLNECLSLNLQPPALPYFNHRAQQIPRNFDQFYLYYLQYIDKKLNKNSNRPNYYRA